MEEHRRAFDYDWRTRFHLPVSVVGSPQMDWREAWSLTRTLLGDSTSQVAASVQDWDRAWSPEAWILADLWDLTAQVNSKRKPKSYPRPNSERPKKFGRATRPQPQIRAALAARGHN